MRVRVRRFLTVLADEAALFLCHDDRWLRDKSDVSGGWLRWLTFEFAIKGLAVLRASLPSSIEIT
jgi:hypothetical protein